MIRPAGFHGRLLGLGLGMAAAFVVLAARAFEITVLRGNEFRQKAKEQHLRTVIVTGPRGAIYDRNGTLLASSLDVPSIFAHPNAIEDREAASGQLAEALGRPVASVRGTLDTGRTFVWLERQARPRQAKAVAALGIDGIGQINEPKRFYPRGRLAAHVLGFVDVDSKGAGGLELALDDEMRGERHAVQVRRDARGRVLFMSGAPAPLLAGRRVELTIDARIQAIAERELDAAVRRTRAKGGVVVVADPMTGEILALANLPTYDPNTGPGRRPRGWLGRTQNQAVGVPFEPGSTLKAVLAATALETGVTTIDETFFCENGRYRYEDRFIHDTHEHGWLSFAEVIQVSSNICSAKVATRLGASRYHRFLRSFGFGERTGIELPGESRGILRPVDRWAGIDLATHSYGQGVAVTPLQMTAAFGAIANGGTLMRPYVVRRVVGPDGSSEETRPRSVRRVVSSRAARLTAELLRRAVEEEGGTGVRARLDDVSVAGKTGTAQKPRPDRPGYSRKRIGSFVGFVPADRPRLVIFVLVDEPETSSYGGVVAAPVFRAIAAEALGLLDLPMPVSDPIVPEAVVAQVQEGAPAEPSPAGEDAAAPGAGERVPRLIGLSLREALTRAHAAHWDVAVQGRGYVTAQTPRPGAPPPVDRTLALTLRADTGRR